MMLYLLNYANFVLTYFPFPMYNCSYSFQRRQGKRLRQRSKTSNDDELYYPPQNMAS